MRHAIPAAALLAAASSFAPAYAAEPVWTPAPVPSISTSNAVTPANRAGTSSGPENASPFSGIPTGAAATNGQSSAPTTAPADVGTPNTSR